MRDLAIKMDAGFQSVRTETKASIEELAIMTQKGFEAVDKRFEKVDENIGEVKNGLSNVNARLDTMQMDFSLMRDDRHRIKLLEDDVVVLKKKIA